jgi:pimeloyl-ACP methyl ester carboxylesterase
MAKVTAWVTTHSYWMAVGLLAVTLTAGTFGCRDGALHDGGTPVIDKPADELDDTRPEDVRASAEHLLAAGVINRWGREPDIDWPAVVTLGELCKLAYDDGPTRRRVLTELGFSDIVLLDELTNSGFIAGNDRVAVIAFRGTDERFDWIANGDFRQLLDLDGARRVHSGFRSAYRPFDQQVQDYLREHAPERVWITGHSLGGAMAACCAYELLKTRAPISGVVTFGQPRVGNEALAQYLDAELGDRYLRLMNEGDPVPILPPCFGRYLPAYWHSGRRAWFFGGELFTTEGPTLYAARESPGDDGEVDEAEGKDEFRSMTEEDFRSLQQQLRATPPPIGPTAEEAERVGAAPPMRSSALVDSVLGFFQSRIGEHQMVAYLAQIQEYRARKPAATSDATSP